MPNAFTNPVFAGLGYAALRALSAAVNMLPPAAAERIGILTGRLYHLIDFRRRRRARRNMGLAEPPVCPPDQVPAAVRAVFEHLGLMTVEILRLHRLVASRELGEFVKLENTKVLDRLLSGGNGILMIIPHLGNWEIAGVALAMAGYPLNSLARPVDSNLFDAYLNRFRTLTGQRIIAKNKAAGRMSQTLDENKILVIQADQRARKRGVNIRFFGRPAAAVRSPALLALRYKRPLVPVEIWRENGRHITHFHEPIDPEPYAGRKDAVEALTQAYTNLFEEFIRRHPSQWLWTHNRWRSGYRTVGEGPSKPAPEELRAARS